MNVCLKKEPVFIVLMAFLAPSLSVGAEKYYTWVDEQGRVHHTVIPEEKNPLIVDKEKVSAKKEVTRQESPQLEEVGSQSEDNFTTKETSSLPVNNEPPPSSFPNSEQVPVTRSVEINEDDYIDGDVLEQQGNIRDESDLPYYTWTDEQGVLRTTPYRPVSEKPNSSKQKKITKKKRTPVTYTVAEEYYRINESVSAEAGSKVDDFARKLFFQESDFISSFSSKCCEELPKTNPYELDFKNSIYIEINKKTENHVFSGGKSPFLLIQLPHHHSNYSLELKSFVKSNSRAGVKSAVFYPQLTFLDEAFEVVRILRKPVLEFTPENWYKHGYLKGLFELDVSKGERFLMLSTTRDDLRSKNRIENDKPIAIHHQKTGSFEIKAIYVD
jgi:maltose operon substrate-binding protein precursor MalM/uncharacterized protein DUF4124